MIRIETIIAREVFDSRGRPTVEVEIACTGKRAGRAIVPSGASTGRFEACELRDEGDSRLGGCGVSRAVENVRGEISQTLIGMDAADQQAIDRTLCELDGTENKSRLGANAILGTSLAVAHAAAAALEISLVEHLQNVWRSIPGQIAPQSQPAEQRERTGMLGHSPLMPLPMVNMISGGLHAGGNLDFQDFLILPVGATSYRQALEWVILVYRKLGDLLSAAGFEGVLVGDEGGYGPKLRTNSQAVEFVIRAIESSRLRPGEDVSLGLDVAGTHFFDGIDYHLAATGDNRLQRGEFVEMLVNWVDSYPIISIEDPLAEDDWQGWQELTSRLGDRVQLIGDDLFVTNCTRLRRGIELGVANSVLVKPNQIGSLWETLETMQLALDNGYWPVISARSGETEDATIADLAVATGAGQIKIGSVARSERLAKYNQLLRLEECLGTEADYLGGTIFSSLSRQ